jgi:lipoate-protein ligase B
MKKRACEIIDLGLCPYEEAYALQKETVRSKADASKTGGSKGDTLILVEHPPIITTGRRGGSEHICASPDTLRSAGIEAIEVDRGGDVTYHGPGQIVGYPIVQLQEDEQDIKRYVTYLEEILIRTAADFGVKAHRAEGLRGIWVGNEKLAAIGVRIAQWTTLHGFAMNVSTDLRDFDLIVPCGLHGRGVTSLEKLLGKAPSIQDVEDRLIFHAAQMLDRETAEAAATSLPNEVFLPRVDEAQARVAS